MKIETKSQIESIGIQNLPDWISFLLPDLLKFGIIEFIKWHKKYGLKEETRYRNGVFLQTLTNKSKSKLRVSMDNSLRFSKTDVRVYYKKDKDSGVCILHSLKPEKGNPVWEIPIKPLHSRLDKEFSLMDKEFPCEKICLYGNGKLKVKLNDNLNPS